MNELLSRFVWNIFVAIATAFKCRISLREGWQCAKECDQFFKEAWWPADVAEYERDIRTSDEALRASMNGSSHVPAMPRAVPPPPPRPRPLPQ